MTDHSKTEHSNEDFLRLFLSNESQLRAFVRSCLYNAGETDEVMQEVSLIAWRKFDSLDDKTRFGAWACLIARYEVLKFRRKKARDRLVLSEEVIEKLGDDAEKQVSRRERQFSVLDECLDQLPESRSKLIRLAYRSGLTKRELALKFGLSEGAFYQKLVRIRTKLRDCMNHRLSLDPQ
jgi:RNA polymerase sigma-70 factor, ECF subfamily